MAEIEIPTVQARVFATKFALRPNTFAWFLGAGASAASGIPTATMMIQDFKKRIYCRETGYSVEEIDTSDRVWQERINLFLSQRDLVVVPPGGNDYATAFESLYTSPRDRRLYIEDQIRKGDPTFGHRVLAAFISGKLTPAVFTTNFDPLVERSVTLAENLLPAERRALPTVAAIDSAQRAVDAIADNRWPIIVKIHGDYQSVSIKNTDHELVEQDEALRGVLVHASRQYGLILNGYSGRDTSVMSALNDVLSGTTPFPGGLYWVTSQPKKVLGSVREFMLNAQSVGVDAAFVQCATFDELAGELLRQMSLPEELDNYVKGFKVRERLVPAPLPNKSARSFPVLRFSALPVLALPSQARRVRLNSPLTTSEARRILRKSGTYAVVAALGTQLAAFGPDKQLIEAFKDYGAATDGYFPLDPIADSWALGLLYEALCRALARGRPIRHRFFRGRHHLLVNSGRPDWPNSRVDELKGALAQLKQGYAGTSLTGLVPGMQNVPFTEGVEVKLESIEGRWWVGFDPSTFVQLPKVEPRNSEAEAVAADFRRERWARRYNNQWNSIIDGWAKLLGSHELSTYGLAEADGVDGKFSVSTITAFSRPGHQHEYFLRTK